MARTRVRYTAAPARNDVYVGMLAVTVLLMAVGCVLLALECNEYEWVETPPVSPAVALPTLPSPMQPPADNRPSLPVTPKKDKDAEAIRPAPPSEPKQALPEAPPSTTLTRAPDLPATADPVGPPVLLPPSGSDPNRLPQPGFNPSLPRR